MSGRTSVASALALVGDPSDVVGWFQAHRESGGDVAAGVAETVLTFVMAMPGVGSGPAFDRVIAFTAARVVVLRLRGAVRALWEVESTGDAAGAFGELADQSYEPTVEVLGVTYQIALSSLDEVKALRRRFA